MPDAAFPLPFRNGMFGVSKHAVISAGTEGIYDMGTLRLGDTAPDFTAETTEGQIRFHEWKAGSWAVLLGTRLVVTRVHLSGPSG